MDIFGDELLNMQSMTGRQYFDRDGRSFFRDRMVIEIAKLDDRNHVIARSFLRSF